MTGLLELPAVRQQVHLMSVDEYHRAGETGVLGEDVELLRGIVITKMPKSPLHEFVAQKLMDLLLAQVPKEFKVRRVGPFTLRGSEPEPDISVVKGKTDDWAKAHPSTAELVIEVAVTSKVLDESKAEIYAEASVPEYWLVASRRSGGGCLPRADARRLPFPAHPQRERQPGVCEPPRCWVPRSERLAGVVGCEWVRPRWWSKESR